MRIRKVVAVVVGVMVMIGLIGCSGSEYTLKYVKGGQLTLDDQYDCVTVFTKFENNSDESVCPADVLEVTAYQHGKELSPMVPTGETTEDYIQCDAKVQSGNSADVVWMFELKDDSDVSVEMPDGSKEKIKLK